MVVIQAGATTAGGVRAGAGSASTLTVVDTESILREDPAVARVSYLARQAGQVQYRDRNWNTAIQGVTPSYLEIVSWHIARGSAMTGYVNSIYVQAGAAKLVSTASAQVTATPARRHHIQAGRLNDFSVRNLSQNAAAGIGFGLLVSYIICRMAQWPTQVSPSAVLGGFAFSAALAAVSRFLRMHIRTQPRHIAQACLSWRSGVIG